MCMPCCRGRFTFNQPEICSGDRFSCSVSITSSLSLKFFARTQSFDRYAVHQALLSEFTALYHRLPLLRSISPDNVDGARFNCRAISQRLLLAERPARLSSRSSIVRCAEARLRFSGLMPPCLRRIVNIKPGLASITPPIALNPTPFFHRSKTQFLSPSVNIRLIHRSSANQFSRASVAVTA